MALTAAGTMYNNNVQKKAAKAQMKANQDARSAANRLRLAEFERQDALKKQSFDRLDENIEHKTRESQDEQLDAERQRVETLYNENIQDATTNNLLLTGMQNAGTNFQEAAAKKLADTSADTRRRLNALARLQSYGGSKRQNQYATVDTNRDIGTVNNFRRGSLSTTNAGRQAILNNPAQVQSGSTLLGDIMIGAGTVGSFAGGAGWNPFGGTPGPSANPFGMSTTNAMKSPSWSKLVPM